MNRDGKDMLHTVGQKLKTYSNLYQKILLFVIGNTVYLKRMKHGTPCPILKSLVLMFWHVRGIRLRILNLWVRRLDIMMHGSQAAWSKSPYAASNRMMAMRHLRLVGWDIPIRNYQNTGVHERQVRPDFYPK